MRLDFEDGVRRLNDGGIRTAADGVFISSRIHAGRIATLENSRIVGIRNNGSFRMSLMRFADHGKKRLVFLFSVDGPAGVKNLVAAVLGVGLSKHHELNIRWIAVQLGKGIN